MCIKTNAPHFDGTVDGAAAFPWRCDSRGGVAVVADGGGDVASAAAVLAPAAAAVGQLRQDQAPAFLAVAVVDVEVDVGGADFLTDCHRFSEKKRILIRCFSWSDFGSKLLDGSH